MSYPRQIQTLIIEDESDPVENYRALFDELAKDHYIAQPVFARSYQDGLDHINGNQVFHLIILDLGLPQSNRGQAQAGIDPGIDLLHRAAERNHLPVPCLLVVSGRLSQAKELSSLADELRSHFWHGKMVNKPFYDDEVRRAIQKAHEYTDVGVHIRDSKEVLRPTVSPREEDLLRRCVLGQVDCIGLDLEWWTHSMSFSGSSAEKKVLAGTFLLGNGQGTSRPSFFKFEGSTFAKVSHHDAALMVHKLTHVKQCFAITAQTRSLLVTQQVGSYSHYPISLATLLCRKLNDARAVLAGVVKEINDQLSSLCQTIEEELPIKEVLWKHHDIVEIERALSRYNAKNQSIEAGVLLKRLMADNSRIWVKRRSCTHGDLNATNIAIEEQEGSYHAYIFDAEGIHRDLNVKDLAMLEITTLLHGPQGSLVPHFQFIYKRGTLDVDLPTDDVGAFIRNALTLIQEVRRVVSSMCEPRIYAIMLFDSVMLQLGGLALQTHGNKITDPADAVELAELTSKWLLSFGG